MTFDETFRVASSWAIWITTTVYRKHRSELDRLRPWRVHRTLVTRIQRPEVCYSRAAVDAARNDIRYLESSSKSPH